MLGFRVLGFGLWDLIGFGVSMGHRMFAGSGFRVLGRASRGLGLRVLGSHEPSTSFSRLIQPKAQSPNPNPYTLSPRP